MNAVVLPTPREADVVQTIRAPVPRPRAGEVLVQVHASVVSLRPPFSGRPFNSRLVPGSNAAGEVVLVGPGVTEWSRGDRVVVTERVPGRSNPGTYADFVTVPAADLHLIPDNVSYAGAVSVARAFGTAWSALFRDGRLAMSERVVVIGAADPIGIAAVQICRWRGSRVVAVADGRHAPRLAALGTTRTISQSAPDLASHVMAGLDGERATVVLNVAGALIPESLRVLGRNGRLIITAGSEPQMLDVRLLVSQQAHVMGSSVDVDAVDVHHILKLLSEGTFIPVIDSIYRLSEAAAAHHRATSEQTFGAVLVVPDHLFESTEKITKLDKES